MTKHDLIYDCVEDIIYSCIKLRFRTLIHLVAHIPCKVSCFIVWYYDILYKMSCDTIWSLLGIPQSWLVDLYYFLNSSNDMHKFKLNYFPRGFNNTYQLWVFCALPSKVILKNWPKYWLCCLLKLAHSSVVADAGESEVYI
jgi:hypothetical protein